MGAFTSRRNAGVEEVDISGSNAYRYPPKSGCYFGSHFIMGGEKFETTQPEAYLFGENTDLNFLGNRPIPFPYPAPQAHEPTKTLKSLVNIRKDSLRFVKAAEDVCSKAITDTDGGEDDEEVSSKYNIEFTFDCDVRVAITVYYFAAEEISNGQAVYHPRDASMNSETYHYKRGANQMFTQASHIIEPAKFGEEEWQYNPDKECIPVVIQCVVEDEQYTGHSHMLFATVEKSSDIDFVLKPLKQKQMVDGLCYLLQEIYGIENKSPERAKLDDDLDDNGSECVICMCETRDTLILPCRHLCLCNMCADNLRYQANNCPICRAPFRALLQIRAMKKKLPNAPTPQNETSDENSVSQEGVPPGYEAVSLIEALNGPDTPSVPTHHVNTQVLPPDGSISPSMKRKGRRSSSRSSRHSRRRPEVVLQEELPTQVLSTAVAVPDTVRTEPSVQQQQQQADKLVTSPPSPRVSRGPSPVEGAQLNMPRVSQAPMSPAEITPDVESQSQDTPQINLPEEQGRVQEPEFQEITIEDDIDDQYPPAYSSHLMLEKEMLDTSTNSVNEETRPLCLLQELSLPGAATEEAGSRGSSYSSTLSTKGLLDIDTVPVEQAQAKTEGEDEE